MKSLLLLVFLFFSLNLQAQTHTTGGNQLSSEYPKYRELVNNLGKQLKLHCHYDGDTTNLSSIHLFLITKYITDNEERLTPGFKLKIKNCKCLQEYTCMQNIETIGIVKAILNSKYFFSYMIEEQKFSREDAQNFINLLESISQENESSYDPLPSNSKG